MNASPAPLFLGQPMFGAVASFVGSPLVGGSASVDAFLGNAPGTTVGPPQAMYGFSGVFQGATSAAVQQQIDALSALATLSGPLGMPVNDIYPSNFRWSPRSCYFLPTEFKPGAITRQGLNSYSAPFALVFREVSQ